MNPKLYTVTIGIIESGSDETVNYDSKNVIAGDVSEAMKKVKLRKNEFFSSVVFISSIDKV